MFPNTVRVRPPHKKLTKTCSWTSNKVSCLIVTEKFKLMISIKIKMNDQMSSFRFISVIPSSS